MENGNMTNKSVDTISVLRKTVERVEIPVGPCTVFFDESSDEWVYSGYEDNLIKLMLLQRYFNDKLLRDSQLDLSEVYDTLKIPTRYDKSGRRLGWVANSESEDQDNYVDFGLYDVNTRGLLYWPNGDPFILLNFNAYDISE